MSKTIKTEIVIITILALFLFTGWSIIDNQSYFKLFEAQAADDTGTATLDVAVGASITLTIDAGAAIDFGTLVAGTKDNNDTTRVKTVSNDTMTLAIGRDRSSPATTLASSADPSNINISDTAGGIDVFNGIGGGSTATWVDSSSTGLGYCLWAAADKDTSTWGTGSAVDAAANKYAALQASSSSSTALTTTASGTKYASIGWSIDVAGDQQATTYTGDVVFKGTTTP